MTDTEIAVAVAAINAAASPEGWAIFHCPDSAENQDGLRPWQVQRDDEAGILSGDYDAWVIVRDGTEPHHGAAREFLGAHSAPELAAIAASTDANPFPS